MKAEGKELTPRELDFINMFFEGMAQTTAYMKAFDNDNYKSSSVQACRLLEKPRVAAEVERRKSGITKKGETMLKALVGKSIEELAKLIDFSSPMDSVKARMIVAVLDRTGFPPKTQQEISGNVGATFQFVGIDDNTFPAAQKPDEADDDE